MVTRDNVERHDVYIPGRHQGHRLVRAEARRENWLDAGRRWRKTSFLAGLGLEDVARHGSRWIYTAPTYKQVRIAWDEIEKGAQGAFKLHKAEMWMECPWNEGTIRFFSLDNPDNARGYTADRVVIDEAADVNPDAWHKVLRPMLLSTHGTLWASGTPKGHNWFWREFRNAEERLRLDPDADCAFWRIPTLGARIESGRLVREPHPYENPTISFPELKRIFEDGSTPEQVFRQEYLAEFLADNAGVFLGVEGAAFGVHLAPPYFGPFCRVYEGAFSIGVDWGRYEDFTVVVVQDVATRRVVDFWRVNQRSWDAIVRGVAAIYRRWRGGRLDNQVTVLVEHNSIGSPNLERLQLAGVPASGWTATNQTKAAIIESLQFDIEHRVVAYPRIQPLMNELMAFQSQRLPSGLIRYAAPEGEHDDCVMALALSNEGTKYCTLDQEETAFRIVLDATAAEDQVGEGRQLLDEYKLSLVAARAREHGIEHTPLGARPALERALEAQAELDKPAAPEAPVVDPWGDDPDDPDVTAAAQDRAAQAPDQLLEQLGVHVIPFGRQERD